MSSWFCNLHFSFFVLRLCRFCSFGKSREAGKVGSLGFAGDEWLDFSGNGDSRMETGAEFFFLSSTLFDSSKVVIKN